MSFISGTQNELLYSFGGASTNLATFTTEDNLLKTYPQCQIIPAQLLTNVGSRSSSLKIVAMGQVGTTGTPTYTFTLRLLTAATFSVGGLVLGTSNAVTGGSTVTLAPWRLNAEIMLRTLPASGSATATVVTMGNIGGPGFPTEGSIPANNTAVTLATIDMTATYYLFLSAACSASNGLNLINTQLFKVYGEN